MNMNFKCDMITNKGIEKMFSMKKEKFFSLLIQQN